MQSYLNALFLSFKSVFRMLTEIVIGPGDKAMDFYLKYFTIFPLTELARDALNKTGRYDVIAGIMSPVSDHYPKKVSLNNFLFFIYSIFFHVFFFYINASSSSSKLLYFCL